MAASRLPVRLPQIRVSAQRLPVDNNLKGCPLPGGGDDRPNGRLGRILAVGGPAALHPYQSLSGPTSTAGSGRQRPSVCAEAAVDRTALASDRHIAGRAYPPAADADSSGINSAGANRGSRERGARSTPPCGRIRRRTRCRRHGLAIGGPFRRSCQRRPPRECASDWP